MSDTVLLPNLPVRHRNDACCAPMVEPGMSADRTCRLAVRLRAVADPVRLRMLDLLVQQPEPLCVCDVTAQFAQGQPTISHHLKLLRDAGLVETEKRGIWSYYWATDAGKAVLAAVQTVM